MLKEMCEVLIYVMLLGVRPVLNTGCLMTML